MGKWYENSLNYKLRGGCPFFICGCVAFSKSFRASLIQASGIFFSVSFNPFFRVKTQRYILVFSIWYLVLGFATIAPVPQFPCAPFKGLLIIGCKMGFGNGDTHFKGIEGVWHWEYLFKVADGGFETDADARPPPRSSAPPLPYPLCSI